LIIFSARKLPVAAHYINDNKQCFDILHQFKYIIPQVQGGNTSRKQTLMCFDIKLELCGMPQHVYQPIKID